MSFGTKIKNLRRDHNMTQENLAEILSISPQAISRWETDMAMPDISLIAPICNLFNITADELLGISLARNLPVKHMLIKTLGMKGCFVTDFSFSSPSV